MALDTGLGTTLTAVPGSWTGNLVDVDLHTSTIPTVDASHLGTTTYREKLVGDLAEPGQVTIRLHFQGTTAAPTIGTTGTLTITDPVASGESTAANWSGTAIITSVGHGVRQIDQLKTLEVVLDWDGYTGPTFTAAT